MAVARAVPVGRQPDQRHRQLPGSDCGHGQGAARDYGDVTWSVSGGTLTITGVVFNGFGGLPVTITVPSKNGHYSEDIVSVFPILGAVLGLPPGAGFSQVQVAP